MTESPTSWHIRALCPCGWTAKAPFGSVFHIHREVCPQCGTRKEKRSRAGGLKHNVWKTVRMRWEPGETRTVGAWWKPWAWERETVKEPEWIVHPDDRGSLSKHLHADVEVRDNVSP